MLEKIHSVTQSINSFIRPMGLSLSNKQQIIARTTMLALAILHLPLITASSEETEVSSEETGAFSGCIQTCNQLNTAKGGYCIRDCMRRHLSLRW